MSYDLNIQRWYVAYLHSLLYEIKTHRTIWQIQMPPSLAAA